MSNVIVHQEPHPEDNAALQAWYSRSNKSVTEHREKLAREGSGKFMDQIFIQYGHASVGDLGTTTVYFEGISMLAAKALQDNPLYNGQECSSRYIDMSSVEMKAPQDAECEREVENLRRFYVEALPQTVEFLKEKHPIEEGQKQSVYEKAIDARAFDILRGFLPCGTTTNVAWSGTLRNFKENLERLRHHPLSEVRNLASDAYSLLYEAYPNSFDKSIAEAYRYEDLCLAMGLEKSEFLMRLDHFYLTGYSDSIISDIDIAYGTMGALGTAKKDSFLVNSDPVSMFARGELLGRLQFTMDRREDVLDNVVSDHIKGVMMPRHGREANTPISVYGTLDFGSFRDLQRHRGGYVGLPLVTGDWGFHRWYVDNLPPALQSRAVDLVFNLVEVYYKKLNEPASIGDLVESKVRLQYMLPMGMIVPVDMVFPLRQLVYFIELRSGQTVHPTLRQFAHSCAEGLEYEGVQLHYDNRPDVWTIRRGDQDIVERNQPTAEGA
jgi:thymidylate synthase ThyX